MPNSSLAGPPGAAVTDDIALARSGAPALAPLVSVIVSTRNHARTLGRTVEAVMRQDLDAEFEMIVVDNASVDGTEAVMRSAVDTSVRQLTYARLPEDRGAGGGRNFALSLARGQYLAFTDSDCTPSSGWLRAALEGFSSSDVGIVQGRTEAAGVAPLFSHFIETVELDGSFSTSNVVYSAKALGGQRFDPRCTYWEDVDLGWRVLADGWTASFARDAVIQHEVVPLTPMQWVFWPRRFANWPAKVARYPGFRRHLVLGVWVSPIHLWFDVAVVGVAVAPWQPITLLFAIPYVVEFARHRSLRGKFPPAKLLAHVAWDAVALGSLLVGSVRNRALVL
jgi:glycosyltransferase involved in cell wall biosynthesis